MVLYHSNCRISSVKDIKKKHILFSHKLNILTMVKYLNANSCHCCDVLSHELLNVSFLSYFFKILLLLPYIDDYMLSTDVKTRNIYLKKFKLMYNRLTLQNDPILNLVLFHAF